MLWPGWYKCRLKLVCQGALAGELGQVLVEVLGMSTKVVLVTRTSPERTGVWAQARLSLGQGVKVVWVRTKSRIQVCATVVYIGYLSVHRPWWLSRIERNRRSRNKEKWNDVMASGGGVSVIIKQMERCGTTWNGDEWSQKRKEVLTTLRKKWIRANCNNDRSVGW